LRDLNTALQGMGIEPGESLFDDMTRWDGPANGREGLYSAPWPTEYRWLAVFYVTGTSEGYYVHINTISRAAGRADKPETICLGLAKTYDRDNAAEIAMMASRLLQV
jgi:hypothetical protein